MVLMASARDKIGVCRSFVLDQQPRSLLLSSPHILFLSTCSRQMSVAVDEAAPTSIDLPPTPDFTTAALGNSAECTTSTSSPVCATSPLFYFTNVTFRVGNTIFRVPRHGFEVPGTVFEAMFSLPSSVDEEGEAEGSSDEHPIVLNGVEENHFNGFLGALYPFVKSMDYDNWVGALHLSTMWEFNQIRERAINAISPILAEKNTVEVVLLAKQYRVLNWLRDAYIRLVDQSSLSIEDLRTPLTLDWETTTRIFYARSLPMGVKPTLIHSASCDINDDWGGGNCSCSPQIDRSACSRSRFVEEVFKTEFSVMCPNADHVEPPLPLDSSEASTISKKKKNKKK
ncbi:unnamed protein product [Cyclocybe aegerita]|uniref:BTB domain-containing protein n=1 Tax=Cyclocybe aegerita TaxID=1973307 RepID=A0A8S0VTH8_CYCAE|nr:unnamed protein product [Cyclocybe aegerita]